MYNGIGLQTARGSGTNGYVQTNKFFIKPRTNKVVVDSSKGYELGEGMAGVTRKPNGDILEHDRKRTIQLKLLVLEEKLIDQGYTDAEIAEKLDEARKSLDVDEGSNSAVIPEKVSETQTHQIAALKEKQMETLKAALGIDSEGDREKKQHDAMATSIEENDDEDEPRNVHKKNTADVRRHRHVKNGRDEKDGMGKVVKTNNSSSDESKFHSKDKIRGVLDDSSDSDSNEKRDRKAKSKPKKDSRRAAYDDDSKIGDHKRRKETSRTRKKVIKHDSDSSGSEAQSEHSSDSGSESDHDKNYGKAHKRYDSDDDNSSDSSFKRSKLKQPSKSRRHDDYSSDEDHGYKTKKSKSKRRNSYDDDESSDEGKHHSQKKTQPRYSRQHDSDGISDEDKHHNQKKTQPRYSRQHESDGSSDDVPKNRTQRLKGPSRSKRHDSDDELYDDRSKKDDNREKHSNKAGDTFKKLEQLYKSKVDGSGDEHERGRWGGQPDVTKSKKLYPTKDKGSWGSEIELDRQNKSYREENHARDSRPPRLVGKNLDADDHGDVPRSRKESRHDNRRDEHYREYRGQSRRERGDGEDLRGRKHDRDGGKDSSRKHEEKFEHQLLKRGRDQEDEHRSRKDERDREHTLKRARYDDARSTGRRDDDDDDWNDDRRPRHR
ncbi:uncharacterized protein LOC142555573 [Primulina tabacum]|uniref:uncharacterized protein LOC142555573 n=1 Tax=Primulina tabacum TaxID=48773 RepID=UPI003F5A9A75